MASPTTPVIIIGGGQSGLAAAKAALDAGLRPLILEAGERPVGSWPHYYDSLTLFSPVEYNALSGVPFPGTPDTYPHRDDVVTYLARYAANLDVEIRTRTRVTGVDTDGEGFVVHTDDGQELGAAGVVAASGSFTNPIMPELPGQSGFTGTILHAAQYRHPAPFAGQRVVVVGAGNSAVQIGDELARVTPTTLASRAPVHFVDQRRLGKDIHHWLHTTGLDFLPPAWLAHMFGHTPVIDTGNYREAVESGLLPRRPMFTAFDGDHVVWADGTREHVDAVIFATGYRPDVAYLQQLGALHTDGTPQHVGGMSTTHPGLVYVGLEFQRSFSSNTLRGVHRDAEHVMRPLAAHITKAAAGINPQPAISRTAS
ncbi:NAD(P)/FAD-dependent oxidoreductase [Actinobacteria bacterium YIM 96077]|uniref:FAD-dependent oxidoreductase n=1 Tax=Phytoactinopolyspora halophila TaxID=1981511 RepID=A0A329R2S2_9ACTN|nr:FAD-dependent oxidoreductase [Phytoactinopolyspora halophila]AYY11899.1 NAD(P)/FAD-dependent oxidoreductase [Actinobacteria bacterium YIM 96077]RAW18867.1 FAD-dependent oxidoreductase [Phytoactinopolyspora halophila]